MGTITSRLDATYPCLHVMPVVTDQIRAHADRNVVGAAVRRLRLARKMSQAELANKLAVHGVTLGRTAINKIEARTRPVFDHQVAAFALALKVPLAELYLRGREG